MGSKCLEEEGGTASWPQEGGSAEGLTGWATPLKKAASDGVGLGGNELGKRPSGRSEEAQPRILGVLCATANGW